MEIKTTYIANDGTEFKTEAECLAYEETLSQMSEYVQLFDRDFSPVEWNPEDYERMWNHTYYIVIEPHREEEVEEWWNNTFCAQLGVSPLATLTMIGSNGKRVTKAMNRPFLPMNSATMMTGVFSMKYMPK